MRAAIAYYDPPQRPAPGARPDFTRLPLTAMPVAIGDLRDARPAGLSLGQEGFTVVTAPTGVHDFYDGDEVARVYPAEAAELLRSLTGCAATAMLNRPVIRVSGRVAEPVLPGHDAGRGVRVPRLRFRSGQRGTGAAQRVRRPVVPADAPPRASIEIRMFAFYD